MSEAGDSLLPSNFAREDDGSSQIVLSADEFAARLGDLPEDEPWPLVIFDQFEELITLFEEATARAALQEAREAQRRIVDVLGRILRDETLRVKLLFGFREDYLAKVKKLLERHPDLVSQSMSLSPPATDALPRIIRGPFDAYPGHFARELSVELAARLTRAIERRSASGVVSLSEVEIVCLRLWESVDPDELLAKRHVRGILEDYLTESLDKFPQELHYLAIALLSQMVTSSGARNVVSVDDLFEHVHEDEPDISEERVELTLNELETKTKLVRRERRHELDLYEITSEFLVPWIARQRQERLKAREQRRVLERARQQRARLMFTFGVVGLVLFALGAAFGALAYYNRAQAEQERKTALSQELALRAFTLLDSQVDPRSRVSPDKSVETAFRAYHSDDDTVEAEEALRAALVESRRRAVLRPSVQEGAISSAAFSSDGKLVVTAGVDGTARVWNAATSLQQGRSLELGAPVYSASFSPDGAAVLTAGADGVARLWDWPSWRRLAIFRHGAPIQSAAFSSDGQLVVTAGDDGNVRVWRATGRALRSLPHSAPAGSAVFSPDGKRVLTAGGDQNARLWDRTTGTVLRRFPHGARTLTATFSPDGKLIATAGESRIVRIWDASTARRASALRGHKDYVTSVDFSPGGAFLVTASLDRTVQVWSADGAHVLTLNGHEDSCRDAAFGPRGKLIVSASQDGTARIWDAGTGRTADKILRSGHSLSSAVFSLDGKQLVTASKDGTATISEFSTGRPVTVLSGHERPVVSATFSTDGAIVVTASEDGTARIWEVATGRQRLTLRHRASVQSAVFSPDGKLVLTTVRDENDHRARVWSTETGRVVLILEHDTPVRSAVFSPDGKLVLTIENLEANLWDVATGRRVGGVESTVAQNSGAFDSDGGRMVIAQADGTATIYAIGDLRDPQLVVALLGHRAPVTSASFSSDGKFVATSSSDGEARVWESQSGRVLNVLRGHEGSVNSAVFSPLEGSRAVVLTAGADGTARLFLCQACLDIDVLVALGHWEPVLEATRD